MPSFSDEELLAVYDDLLSNLSVTGEVAVGNALQLPSEASIDQELETYAQKGDVQQVDELMSRISDGRYTLHSVHGFTLIDSPRRAAIKVPA